MSASLVGSEMCIRDRSTAELGPQHLRDLLDRLVRQWLVRAPNRSHWRSGAWARRGLRDRKART
eukprot:4186208-Alexandrium_andersonii.AAC.1